MLWVDGGAHLALHNVNVIRGRVTDAPGEELYKGTLVVGAGVLVVHASVTMEAVTVANCTAIATDAGTLAVAGAGVYIASGAFFVLIGSHIDGCRVIAGARVAGAEGGCIILAWCMATNQPPDA